jgi:Transmembrane domain of unknown function (DUF3566)
MVQRLSRFSVGQTAKVLGILYGLMGLIALPIFLILAMFSPEEDAPNMGFALVIPILYGVLGFVFTAIGCAVYNWVAGKVGGIEVTLDSAVERV